MGRALRRAGLENRLVHYAYYQDGQLVVESLQPEEHTLALFLLFDTSVVLTAEMSKAVQTLLDRRENE